MLAQVDQTPGAHPIALGLRPVQDGGLERGLLTRAELLRAAGPGPVMQTVRSLGLEALDGIVQGLTLHASRAASARVIPSSALAIARSRRTALGSRSRAARWRKSAGEES